jgi:predicted TIM-barrel fold metal-dependent hydrolase
MTQILGVTHTKPDFDVPKGACDCHTHIFGPAAKYPYWSRRVYTPPEASIAEMRALHRQLGIDRVVIVHPSVYGTDNRCSIDAAAALGYEARVVAVIDPDISEVELEAMHKAGVRGVRLNLETAGVSDPAASKDLFFKTAARVKPFGWHVQFFTNLGVIAALEETFAASPVPIVIDHFGRANAAGGTRQKSFDALLRLIEDGRAYVKLSAAYRVSDLSDCADVADIAGALIAANADRMLWGTDWPHPGGARHAGLSRDEIEPLRPIDDGAALNRLARWAGDRGALEKVLVANPARLYGF